MKLFISTFAAILSALSCYGQGQVVFANKVGTTVDAPVTLVFNPGVGPGPTWSAQLYLQGPNGSLTSLTPASTFRPAGQGAEAIADRYWFSQTVDVPVQPGTDATFIVRAWLTSAGSYNPTYWSGQSDPFTVTVGGGTLPPANLTTLKAFRVGPLPEPSTIAIGVLGASVLLLSRRGRS